jgi:hypothetical protein
MYDAKNPVSLLIAIRNEGYAQVKIHPERHDSSRASIEHKINVVALHAQHSLTDEAER